MKEAASRMRAAIERAQTGASGLVARVMAGVRPGSVLVVPVPAAEPAVAGWLGREAVGFDGIPLHVTIMFPFLPARLADRSDEAEIAALARDVQPFTFALTRLGRFPGVHYLAPEPAAPFIELTERVQHRWPACLPYGGAFDKVIPHLTVAFGDQAPADPAALARLLPVVTRADELWWLQQSPRGWRIRRRFPFGGNTFTAPGGHPDGPGVGRAC